MKRQTLFSRIRLPKALWMAAIGAAMFGAGIGATSVQAYDGRCQQCQWNLQACSNRCDMQGGETECFVACYQQWQLCVATFCP